MEEHTGLFPVYDEVELHGPRLCRKHEEKKANLSSLSQDYPLWSPGFWLGLALKLNKVKPKK